MTTRWLDSRSSPRGCNAPRAHDRRRRAPAPPRGGSRPGAPGSARGPCARARSADGAARARTAPAGPSRRSAPTFRCGPTAACSGVARLRRETKGLQIGVGSGSREFAVARARFRRIRDSAVPLKSQTDDEVVSRGAGRNRGARYRRVQTSVEAGLGSPAIASIGRLRLSAPQSRARGIGRHRRPAPWSATTRIAPRAAAGCGPAPRGTGLEIWRR